MIAYLSGALQHVSSDSLVLSVNGLGYWVHVPAYLAQEAHARLLEKKPDFSLWCVHQQREDSVTLYGMESVWARSLFLIINNVSGIGGRMALSLFSSLGVHGVLQALLAGKEAALTQAEGVGPKLAARVIRELDHKRTALTELMNQILDQSAETTPTAHLDRNNTLESGPVQEAISALTQLGYSLRETQTLVQNIFNRAKSDKIFPDPHGSDHANVIEYLVRHALKNLAGQS